MLLIDGSIVALDSKVIIDDNALFRHPELIKYEEVTELESLAKKNGFSFVQLQGNIAIIGNGAGLVMSTLDMVSDAGGNAGAFLDFGGSATSETIYQALTVISRVKTVQTIVVNLFGGIVRYRSGCQRNPKGLFKQPNNGTPIRQNLRGGIT